MNTVNYMQGAISAWTLLVSYHIIMCIMKFIFILGSFFKRGHCWQFWCFTHTDCRKCAKHGVCSVMDLCQAYSTSPVYYHRVYIQHEQDKLFMCQLPDNVWIKILYILILQRSKLKLWLIFKHFFFVNRVKTLSQQVNLINGTSKTSIYTQFIQPFLSRQLSGAVKMFLSLNDSNLLQNLRDLRDLRKVVTINISKFTIQGCFD